MLHHSSLCAPRGKGYDGRGRRVASSWGSDDIPRGCYEDGRFASEMPFTAKA